MKTGMAIAAVILFGGGTAWSHVDDNSAHSECIVEDWRWVSHKPLTIEGLTSCESGSISLEFFNRNDAAVSRPAHGIIQNHKFSAVACLDSDTEMADPSDGWTYWYRVSGGLPDTWSCPDTWFGSEVITPEQLFGPSKKQLLEWLEILEGAEIRPELRRNIIYFEPDTGLPAAVDEEFGHRWRAAPPQIEARLEKIEAAFDALEKLTTAFAALAESVRELN